MRELPHDEAIFGLPEEDKPYDPHRESTHLALIDIMSAIMYRRGTGLSNTSALGVELLT
jgi:hypothetical protein